MASEPDLVTSWSAFRMGTLPNAVGDQAVRIRVWADRSTFPTLIYAAFGLLPFCVSVFFRPSGFVWARKPAAYLWQALQAFIMGISAAVVLSLVYALVLSSAGAFVLGFALLFLAPVLYLIARCGPSALYREGLEGPVVEVRHCLPR